MSTPSLPAADTKPDPDLSGRTLGDYQMLRRLGRGGMADVYLAEQKSLRRQVAFKVLKRSLADDESYVRRFHREAQAAAALVHANIVQIHEVGFLDGVHFIAQEYVSGQNLRQILSRRGPITAPVAAKVMRQVASALQKAGEQGIIHRDIKPENIMLSADHEVKVADFGLAHVATDSRGLNLTQVGLTMGTPLYMSPEQVEGKPVDPRSDIYSFGVTCYHMLSGRPPFEAETALGVAVQHLKKEPVRLETLRPDIPEGLCQIVHKMLAKEPEQRYQRASELIRDLRALRIEGNDDDWPADMENWPTEPGTTPGQLAATQQLAALMQQETQQRSRRWPAILVASLMVVVAVMLGALLAWITRPEPLLSQTTPAALAVTKLDSSQAQYYHAIGRNTEEAWLSVAKYFPPTAEPRIINERYALLAKLRLAEFYSDQNRLAEANKAYNEVINYETSDRQYEAFALAQQASLLERRGDHDAALAKLQHLGTSVMPTLDERYRQQVLQQLDSGLRPNLEAMLAARD
ncbi:MAG: protein kinase [Pirellulaceae bacterium]